MKLTDQSRGLSHVTIHRQLSAKMRPTDQSRGRQKAFSKSVCQQQNWYVNTMASITTIKTECIPHSKASITTMETNRCHVMKVTQHGINTLRDTPPLEEPHTLPRKPSRFLQLLAASHTSTERLLLLVKDLHNLTSSTFHPRIKYPNLSLLAAETG